MPKAPFPVNAASYHLVGAAAAAPAAVAPLLQEKTGSERYRKAVQSEGDSAAAALGAATTAAATCTPTPAPC